MEVSTSGWLARLLGARRGDYAAAPQVPADSCVYAVGDIHGRVDLLAALHRQIVADAASRRASRKVVVYIGDYVDRGEESNRVLDLLLDQPLQGFQSVYLKGNHEDSLLAFLADPAIGCRWVQFGGDATLYSYGVRPPASTAGAAEFEAARREFAERLPARHLRFLETLVHRHVEGDYFFAHAGVRPGVGLAAQSPEDLLWIREDFLDCEQSFGKIVVHGHSISGRPDVQHNRIGIDTGAFASGRLTCLVLERAQRSFLQT